MLPYTPLHVLLFANGAGPLVMTSGNPSDEPLCSDNDQALRRLAGMADAWLLHDRDIERPIDDSVVMTAWVPAEAGGATWRVVPLRRARGYVPGPVHVPVSAAEPILAVGGELKSAVCLLTGSSAVVSEHLGELPNPKAYRNFLTAIERLGQLLRAKPKVVACDLHPDYAATRFAQALAMPAIGVQHHHAHVVACMADNGLTGRVIGVSCDGAGYGTDGTTWGCEILACDEADFERAAHLRPFPLPGRDAGAIHTWRPAVSLLLDALGPDWRRAVDFIGRRVDERELAVVERLMTRPARLPQTSSLGRLFDAAACLLGLCDRNRHEAEAPMALEAAAWKCPQAEPLAYDIAGGGEGAPIQLDVRAMIRELAAAVGDGQPTDWLARAFHETIAAMLADGVGRVAERTGLDRVMLTGGCFANRLLTERLAERLATAGLNVYVHRHVPPGDGGIALGQAVVAAARIRQNG